MQGSTRVSHLISQLTLDEKIGLVHGNGFFETKGVKRLGIPPLKMSDGPMGVRQEFPKASWKPLGLSNDYVTYFPSNTALAATWNQNLAYQFGQDLGEETRARGKDIILGPGINIIRSPLCGRNFEYMSEDPTLTATMTVPLIRGIQEKDVAACVKHFAANNQETRRLEVNVEADPRSMEEIYLPAFKAAFTEAGAYTAMAAYNLFRGTYCCENTWLLDEVLRNQLAYDGVVISDWGANHSTEAAALAGLDIEMSVTDDFDDYYFGDPLYHAIESGKIPLKVLDAKVARILSLMEKLKIFDHRRSAGSLNTRDHQDHTYETAIEAIVLLKNDRNFLPLSKNTYKSIAVIGDNANRLHAGGGGSAEIKALYEISPLAGLSAHLGGNHKITFVQGYRPDETAPSHEQFNLREQAVRAAKAHDLVIFVGGLNHDHDREGQDRLVYTLPYEQDLTIMALAKANPNLIVVNLSGSPVDLSVASTQAKALIQTWYNGMEGGRALAHLLFGQKNPSGKLPMTFAKNLEDYSSHSLGEFPGDEKVDYTESIFVGYRHFDSHHLKPLYPFGHGLSYTDFDYDHLVIEKIADGYQVSCDIKNIGTYEGKEVVQVYLHDEASSEPRPYKELKAFTKVSLLPEEITRVTFTLTKRDFSFFSEKAMAWVAEAGKFKILIGSSSRDIRLEGDLNLFLY